MKRSFILISDTTENEILNALMDFANLYPTEAFVENIEVYKQASPEIFLVQFTNHPGFEHFCYTVNYLRYSKPPGNPLPAVKGYYLNQNALSDFYSLQPGFLKIYVAENDTAYDNVIVVNDQNESYLFDFGGRHRKLETIEAFEVPVINTENYQHVLNIIPAPKEAEKPWWKFW